jgi:acetate---CoA ligase (ADP-forming) subunit beta
MPNQSSKAKNLAQEIAGRIITTAQKQQRQALLEPEAKQICIAYGIPTPSFRVAHTPSQATFLAEQVAFPVVLKIISYDILHKTEADGVILSLNSKDQVKAAYEQLLSNVREYKKNSRIDGVLVQHMAPRGVEVIVGGLRDSQFGPTVLFGLGGIFVEVLKDASFRVAPITDLDTRQMIREIRSYPILQGVRGQPPADEDAIAGILQATSRMLIENPEIQQIDLNPVMVYGKGATVVDARIVLT